MIKSKFNEITNRGNDLGCMSVFKIMALKETLLVMAI
jgi:hypothetical protein